MVTPWFMSLLITSLLKLTPWLPAALTCSELSITQAAESWEIAT